MAQDEDWDPEDEPELRPQRDYPWFWPDDEFTGDRRNDIHLSLAAKTAHRFRRRPGRPMISFEPDGLVKHTMPTETRVARRPTEG